MTEEFKKEYDRLQNIEKAKEIAKDYGYACGYEIDTDKYGEACRKEICQLVGSADWPPEVRRAYDIGHAEGCADLLLLQS